MSHPALAHPLLPVAAFAAAGVVLGLAYFALLRRTTVLLAGGRGWMLPVLLTLARLAAVAALLVAAARFGAAVLLAAFLGFLLARAVSLRAGRSAG